MQDMPDLQGEISIRAQYERDGFVFPLTILTEAEADAIRSDYEAAESSLHGDSEKLGLLSSYPDRLLPSFDKLIRNPRMLAAAQQILGPDLMVWSAGMFDKAAHSPHIVSWHQDLTYWGLDDVQEVTCWVALSPASRQSGCMQFIPGSHKRRAVPHTDTFAADNLLTRGQEVAVDVNQDDAVYVELKSGQASLHHGHLFHASDPNKSDRRRIASAIRFIRPSMKQRTGEKPIVALVAGEDRYGNFDVTGAPAGRLLDDEFERCRRDAAVRRQVLYAGAETAAAAGKRYGNAEE